MAYNPRKPRPTRGEPKPRIPLDALPRRCGYCNRATTLPRCPICMRRTMPNEGARKP